MNKKKFLCCFILCCLHVSLCAKELIWKDVPASGFSVEVRVADDTVKLEQNLKVTLEITHPDHYDVDRDELRTHLLAPITLEDRSRPPFSLAKESEETLASQNQIVRRIFHYELEPWQAGTFALSFLDINFFALDGWQKPTVPSYSEVFAVNVIAPSIPPVDKGNASSLLPFNDAPSIQISEENKQKLLENEEKVRNERERLEKLLERRDVPWKLIIALAAALTLLWTGFKIIKKHLLKRSASTPPVDPRKKALDSIKELNSLDLPERGEFDLFFFQLTHIVRIFIEDQYRIKAPERTTQEFLQEIAHSTHFTPKVKQELEEFLGYADMVKFAGIGSTEEECRRAENAAIQFVMEGG